MYSFLSFSRRSSVGIILGLFLGFTGLVSSTYAVASGFMPPVVTLIGSATGTALQNTETFVVNSFNTGGVAQGWHADDSSWAFVLPFDFPYYEVTYTSGSVIKISSNGHICLDGTSNCDNTSGNVSDISTGGVIAPLWRDLYTENETTGGMTGSDIYLTTDPNFVTFRWQATQCCGVTYPVNFSATLFKNGQIRFDYGDQLNPYDIMNTSTGSTVGLGKGDGVNYVVSSYQNSVSFNQLPSSLWAIQNVYNDPGAEWSDDADGTGSVYDSNFVLSGSIDFSHTGSYILEYIKTDSSGNTGSVTRTVQVVTSLSGDITAPVVTLVGSGTISLANGATYTELGATWSDNVDGTGTIITANSGSVNTTVAGTYTLTYRKVDIAGNTGSTTRTVVVAAPVVSSGGGGGGGSSYVAPAVTQPSTTPQSTTTPIIDTHKSITKDSFDIDNKTPKKSKTLTTTTTLKNGTKVVVYRTLPNGKELKVGTARVVRGTIKYQVRSSGKYRISTH